jgi:hypothetical protein
VERTGPPPLCATAPAIAAGATAKNWLPRPLRAVIGTTFFGNRDRSGKFCHLALNVKGRCCSGNTLWPDIRRNHQRICDPVSGRQLPPLDQEIEQGSQPWQVFVRLAAFKDIAVSGRVRLKGCASALIVVR